MSWRCANCGAANEDSEPTCTECQAHRDSPGNMRLRVDNSPSNVAVYSSGFEIARYDPDGEGWMIRIDGKLVSLEKLIRQLNQLQSILQAQLG